MTKSGATLFYFGIYVLIVGILIIAIPTSFVEANMLPPIPDPWARIIGLLLLVIGGYDVLCGKYDVKLFIRWSIYFRIGFAAGTLVLVLAGQMPPTLLVLGAIDAMAAIWTIWALKTEANAGH